jgi:hypothetical protein
LNAHTFSGGHPSCSTGDQRFAFTPDAAGIYAAWNTMRNTKHPVTHSLRLTRETIRTLATTELSKIGGGTIRIVASEPHLSCAQACNTTLPW